MEKNGYFGEIMTLSFPFTREWRHDDPETAIFVVCFYLFMIG